MIKKWLIEFGIKAAMWIIIVGIGIWYLSHSIGGASLSYTSVSSFMSQIGAENGDISSVNGCFLCKYIYELFAVLGRATEMFWNGIVHNLWILMSVGFGIFIILHTLNYIRETATSKDVKNQTDKEPVLDFKKWFDKVWKTGLRVLIAGALIGAINWSGTSALKTITNLTVTPVMYIGSTLSMAATGTITHAACEMNDFSEKEEDILNPVLKPFMCVMGNLNAVILAGAGGGFALMNYSWLGLGGGAFTWLAGLALVIIFLFIGFDLVFQVLSVLFKLIFIIIFMPLLIGAAAFEEVWALAKGLFNTSVDILITSAIAILKISIKISIIFAIVYFSADNYYPSPEDGFTTILPPLMGTADKENMDQKTLSIMNAFATCEKISLNSDNEMDKDKFKQCFKTQRNVVESKYPGAFDFMDDGFEFLLFMIGVACLYFWVVSPKVDDLLNKSKDKEEKFDYGAELKKVGKTAFNAPSKIYFKIKDILDNG